MNNKSKTISMSGIPSDVIIGHRFNQRYLQTHSMSGLNIACGCVPGHKHKRRFGKNPDVSITSFETIWNGGNGYSGFNATAAEPVTIMSTSTDDSIMGIGLQKVRLIGLGDDYTELVEEVWLSGTTPKLSTNSFVRLDTVVGISAGSTGNNIGTITIAQSITTANVFGIIPPGYNTTMIAAYTIPAGKTGYLFSQSATISNKNAAVIDIRIKSRQYGGVFVVGGEAALNSAGTSFINLDFEVPISLPEKTDILIEAEASHSCAVSAFMDIILVDNDII